MSLTINYYQIGRDKITYIKQLFFKQVLIASGWVKTIIHHARGQYARGGILPIMAYTGRLCPKGVNLVMLQVYDRVGFHKLKYMRG